MEILQAIRAEIGEEFPIILRFSQWKQQDYEARLATSPDQLAEFLEPLSDAGVDIFHCSQRRFWETEFPGSELNLAGWVKKITGKPSISVGSVSLTEEFIATYRDGNAEVAGLEELIKRMAAEEFDLIAVGRALIANADWPRLVRQDAMDKLQAYDKAMLAELV